MKKNSKAAAIAPSVWVKNTDKRKLLVIEGEVFYPIAFSKETGQPYMDAPNFIETGKREEINQNIKLPADGGEEKELSIKITLVEYKYTTEKGDTSKFWIPLAPAQKDLIEYLKLARDVEKVARAFKNYTNLTIATNPVILNSGIPEIGIPHAFALTGNEITKESEEILSATLKGVMSPSEAAKEIEKISSGIQSNFIDIQEDYIKSTRFVKALDQVIKILEKNGSTSANLVAMQSQLGKSDMTPVIANTKVETSVKSLNPNDRSATEDRNNINFI